MKQIVVIGGGFAGQMALHSLNRERVGLEVTLVDSRRYADFLPLLPDVIGGRIGAPVVRRAMTDVARNHGCRLVASGVAAVDPARTLVILQNGEELRCDAIVISSGSETNFYGNSDAIRYAWKLDDADDAIRIRRAIIDDPGIRQAVVVGGGYTGVEVAANLRRLAHRHRDPGFRVTILERGPTVLNALPEWMRTYAADRLRRLGIECATGMSISRIAARRLELDGGRVFDDTAIVWCAGVHTPLFARQLSFSQTAQGRLVVDANLRVAPGIFAAGDTAAWLRGNAPLRMSIQYARLQGCCAGRNAARAVTGRPLIPFRPLDPGYVIPIAGGGGCGSIFGLNLSGLLPMMLHYAMCLYRLPAFRQRRLMLADMIFGTT